MHTGIGVLRCLPTLLQRAMRTMQVRPSGSENAVPSLRFYPAGGKRAGQLPLLRLLGPLLNNPSWQHVLQLLRLTEPDASGQLQQLILLLDQRPGDDRPAADGAALPQLITALAGALLELRCLELHVAVSSGCTDSQAADSGGGADADGDAGEAGGTLALDATSFKVSVPKGHANGQMTARLAPRSLVSEAFGICAHKLAVMLMVVGMRLDAGSSVERLCGGSDTTMTEVTSNM